MNLSLAVFDGFHILSLMKSPMEDAKKQYADIAVQYSLPENCWLVHVSIVLIIELKDDEFRHADLSQLNAYVSYFKENEMNEGDNPPVGILLCTRKGERWWNMHWQVWIITCLSLLTCFHCLTNRCYKISC